MVTSARFFEIDGIKYQTIKKQTDLIEVRRVAQDNSIPYHWAYTRDSKKYNFVYNGRMVRTYEGTRFIVPEEVAQYLIEMDTNS